MNIFLDNIIFSLQNAGGISNLWGEELKRLIKDQEVKLGIIDYHGDNIFRKELQIPESMLLQNPNAHLPIQLQRYLSLNIKGKGIFHSSYYRSVLNPNIINITTVHDFTYEYYRKGLPKLIHHQQKNRAIQAAQRIICVSNNTKEDLMRFYPRLDKKKVRVVYNGVSDLFRSLSMIDSDSVKQLIRFQPGEFVLFVGSRKATYKNFELAVEACHQTNLPLVIVGGGPLSFRHQLLLNKKLGSSHYQLFAQLSREELNLLYNLALCLVYPSLYEGFGLPVIEAQKAGCPVISTNFSSIPEIAGNGALLLSKVTPPHLVEALNQLQKNSTLVASIRSEGFYNSKRFDLEQYYLQTKAVYREAFEAFF